MIVSLVGGIKETKKAWQAAFPVVDTQDGGSVAFVTFDSVYSCSFVRVLNLVDSEVIKARPLALGASFHPAPENKNKNKTIKTYLFFFLFPSLCVMGRSGPIQAPTECTGLTSWYALALWSVSYTLSVTRRPNHISFFRKFHSDFYPSMTSVFQTTMVFFGF